MNDILTTLGYTAGELVQATVEAFNSKGWSTPSEANTEGEVAKDEPYAPSNLAAFAPTNSSITLTWDFITSSPENGYSPVLEYQVYWDEGIATQGLIKKVKTSANTATITDLEVGGYYIFAVSAINKYGEGDQSNSISEQSSIRPDTMDAPVLTQSGTQLTITWTAPTDNGAAISDYYILLLDESSDTYIENETLCDGTTQVSTDPKTCTIEMSEFLDTLGYTIGQSISAKAVAHNLKGDSPESAVSNTDIVAQDVPQGTVVIETATATSTYDTITIYWNELTTDNDIGYSAITEYTIDITETNTTTPFTSAAVSAGTRTYTATGLTNGYEYEFVVTPANVHGDGTPSTSYSMVAASKPDQMSKVVVSQTTDSTLVTFTWTQPTLNGLPVNYYTIKLMYANGTYEEQPSLCDGTDSGVKTALSCDVEMASLESTLLLSPGDYIKATATATNDRGTSDESSASDDSIRLQVAPQVAPSGLTGTATKDSITLTWTALTADSDIGYAEVKYYIVYNVTDVETQLSNVTSDTTTVTYTSLSPSGNTFAYKVSAENIHGEGVQSASYDQLLAGIPDTMDAPVLTQSGTQLTITWTAPTDNGAAISDYYILLLDESSDTYIENETLCDGTTQVSTDPKTCTIEMSEFLDTLGYTIGQSISAKAVAHNLKGDSPESAVSNTDIVAQDVPQGTVVIETATATSTYDTITIYWNELTTDNDIGYSAITEYTIDITETNTTTPFTSAAVSAGTRTYTATGLTNGYEYEFVVTPANVHGDGTPSTSYSMVAASKPDQMSKVVVSQTTDSTLVTFTWTQPTLNGLPVNYYTIKLMYANGTYEEQPSLCDGTDSGVKTALSCDVEMASLESTLLLSPGDYIKATATATNDRGTSDESSASDDSIRLQVAPQVAPSGLTGTATKDSITLTWTALTADSDIGYAEVKYYIVYNVTDVETQLSNVTSDTTTVTYTSLSPSGNTFAYKVSAENIHGEGVQSASYDQLLAGIPDTMDAPVLTQSGTQLTITWTAPTDNGAAISDYYILLLDESSDTYIENETLCDGTTQVSTDPKTCTIEMSEFLDTLGYTIGQSISAKAVAHNLKGDSPESAVSNTDIVAQDVPQGTVVIETATATSTYDTITIYWNELTTDNDIGYSAITEYTIDITETNTTTPFTSAAVSAGTRTYTATGLTNGYEYEFVVTPANVHGDGTPSTSYSMVAASKPDQMSKVVVSQTTDSTLVTFTWTQPTLNGLPVNYYTIKLMYANGTYEEQPSLCDGTDSGVKTALSCDVEMASLESTLLLSPGDYIKATATATNDRGTSDESSASDDSIRLQVAPQVAPSGLTGTATKDSITLTWTALTADSDIGYAEVKYYIVYNVTDVETQLSNVTSDTTTVTYTSLSPSGNTFAYKVSAENIHGEGVQSASYDQLLAGIPDTMDAPVLTQSGTQLTITWTAPTDNGAAISDYYILLLDESSDTYIENETLCDGTTQVSTDPKTCTIEMSEFLDTLGYTIGQSISAKAVAHNLKGDSPESAVSNTDIVAQDVPQGTVVIETATATSTYDTITIYWNELTTDNDIGYSAITEYTIDITETNTTTPFTSAAVSAGTRTYTATGLTNGYEYEFVVTPANVHGDGTPSTSYSMVAASKPDQMSKVVVSQTTDSTLVTFTWTQPTLNGLPVNYYTIKLMYANGTYEEQPSLCDGTDSGVKTALSCDVEMASLESTLLLSPGDYIKATATATNDRGTSDESSASDDSIRLQVAPQVAPSGLTGTATKDSITLTWTALTADSDIGYAEVKYYIVYNVTDVETQLSNVTSDTTTVTYTSLSPSGNTFAYKVSAENIHGEGVQSASYDQLLAGIPDTMDAPVLTQSGTQLTITWTAPTDNGAAISDYYILLLDESSDTYIENETLCDGTTQVSTDPKTCTIEMSEFLDTLGYTIGQSISAKAVAHNLKGDSPESAVSNTDIVAQDVPQGTVVIETATATSTYDTITIYWNELTTDNDIGYSAITEYTIDITETNTTTPFTSAAVSAGTRTYTATGLTNGYEYEFVVTPANVHGDGTPSTSYSMVAASKPDQMSKVVVSQTTDSTLVTFTWTQPTLNGLPVNYYTIKLMYANGTYEEQPSLCDGTDSGVKTALSCDVEMASLESTLLLSPGDYIKATATATNDRGTSDESSASDDSIRLQVAPQVAPSGLTGTATKDSITLTWTALTADSDIGYAEVKYYIVYNVTDVETQLSNVTSDTTTVTYTSLSPSGNTFAYKVSAENIHGEGVQSASYDQLLAGIPDTMDAPVLTQSGTQLTITWTAPTDNGAAISDYYILLLDESSDTYIENETLCDGTTQVSTDPKTCTIEMSEFLDTLGYTIGQSISAKAVAHNLKGDSPESAVSNTDIVAQDVPQGTVVIETATATSTYDTITIYWNELTTDNDIGYSAITEYTIDITETNTTTPFTSAAVSAGTRTYTATGLTNGYEYEFVVTPANVHGDGTPSTSYSMVAASKPDQMSKVVVSQTTDSTLVTFTWTQPTLNGLPVNYYTIKLMYANGTYEEQPSLCDGTDSGVKTALSCDVEMASLESTLLLSPGDYIKATATATNDRGTSDESSASDDSIRLQVAPQVAPSGLTGTATKDSITLTWTALTADSDIGYAEVKYYIVYNVTDVETQLSNVTSDTTTVTYTSLSPSGNTFAYKVSAENIHGEGVQSASYDQLLAGIPDTMDAPVLTQSGTQLTITWTAPTDNGAAISDYYILLLDESSDTYIENETLCDGTTQVSTDPKTCTIEMSEFLDTLGYTIGQSISAKAVAHNLKGDSPESAVSNTDIVAQDVPQGTVVIETATATSTYDTITIYWNELTTDNDIGYSAITEYTIDITETNTTTPFTSAAVSAGTRTYTATGLTNGYEYEFVVTPANVHGDGTPSTSYSMVAASKPDQMSKVVVSQTTDSTLVTFTWTQPTLNGLPVNYYTIKLMYANGTYEEQPSLCDGTDSGVKTALSCDVEMASLESTLLLSPGDYIKATATATNDRGTSDESSASDDSIRLQVAPQVAPSGLTGTATKDSITLTWTALTADSDIGYAEVKYYIVYNVTDVETQLSNVTSDTTTVTYTSLSPSGNTFAYKVSAENIHGEGVQSASYDQLLAGIPDTMDAPVLTQSGTQLTITWTAPTDNGAAISDYYILLLDESSDTYIENETLCDGTTQVSTDPKTCTIEMSEFLDTLGYTIGQSISAKAVAHNLKGDSPESAVSNTDIVAQDVPQGTVVIETATATSTYDTITIYWNELTTDNDIGYSAITEYTIDITETNTTTPFTSAAVSAGTRTYTATGLTNGYEYEFVVTPANVHGDGTPSTSYSMVAFDKPSVVQNLSVTLNSGNVVINWDVPTSDNGSPITSYPIKIYSETNTSYETLVESNCAESDVLASTQCTLTETYVKSQFGLQTGDIVNVEVYSHNEAGDSAAVQASSSAL